MKALRAFSGFIGVLATLMGLLWVGQGLGIIMWPETSFMLADRRWALNGSILALVGLAICWLSLRKR